MSLEQDRIKSLLFAYPETIPVSVGILPAAWMKYREALDKLVCSHPAIFGECKVGERDYDAVHTSTYVMGCHIDVWGCVWSNLTTGMESIVTQHPVPTRADVRKLKMPEVDAGFPHGFMYLRLLDLRGFEEVMLDFAEEPPELKMLIDTVLAYNLRQAKILLAELAARGEKGSIVVFGDDLGMQHQLAISPKIWRQYLKPCFTQIYMPFRDAGYYVYMHTDGHILEIIPDLVDSGVNVVNPQIGANGLDNLVEVCKGKVCVDLDLDRQKFPFFSPRDIDDHIHEAVDKLGSPAGGLWLKAEIGQDVPLANIAAIFDALDKYRTYYV
jgi:uroporphyrinogen decarboxylase